MIGMAVVRYLELEGMSYEKFSCIISMGWKLILSLLVAILLMSCRLTMPLDVNKFLLTPENLKNQECGVNCDF